NSCPRDSMLVIGDEIIETPMVWPCRYADRRRGPSWGSRRADSMAGVVGLELRNACTSQVGSRYLRYHNKSPPAGPKFASRDRSRLSCSAGCAAQAGVLRHIRPLQEIACENDT